MKNDNNKNSKRSNTQEDVQKLDNIKTRKRSNSVIYNKTKLSKLFEKENEVPHELDAEHEQVNREDRVVDSDGFASSLRNVINDKKINIQRKLSSKMAPILEKTNKVKEGVSEKIKPISEVVKNSNVVKWYQSRKGVLAMQFVSLIFVAVSFALGFASFGVFAAGASLIAAQSLKTVKDMFLDNKLSKLYNRVVMSKIIKSNQISIERSLEVLFDDKINRTTNPEMKKSVKQELFSNKYKYLANKAFRKYDGTNIMKLTPKVGFGTKLLNYFDLAPILISFFTKSSITKVDDLHNIKKILGAGKSVYDKHNKIQKLTIEASRYNEIYNSLANEMNEYFNLSNLSNKELREYCRESINSLTKLENAIYSLQIDHNNKKQYDTKDIPAIIRNNNLKNIEELEKINENDKNLSKINLLRDLTNNLNMWENRDVINEKLKEQNMSLEKLVNINLLKDVQKKGLYKNEEFDREELLSIKRNLSSISKYDLQNIHKAEDAMKMINNTHEKINKSNQISK